MCLPGSSGSWRTVLLPESARKLAGARNAEGTRVCASAQPRYGGTAGSRKDPDGSAGKLFHRPCQRDFLWLVNWRPATGPSSRGVGRTSVVMAISCEMTSRSRIGWSSPGRSDKVLGTLRSQLSVACGILAAGTPPEQQRATADFHTDASSQSRPPASWHQRQEERAAGGPV